MQHEASLAYARSLDQQDPLKKYRAQFSIPTQENGQPYIYFCGNSLGVRPHASVAAVQTELDNWKNLGVKGHFKGAQPWVSINDSIKVSMAKVVGAMPKEVAVMNTLTANLHFLMASFYRPEGKRRKILIESDAFPSDRYVVESQIKFHGFDPAEDIIKVFPQEGEELLALNDIIEKIEKHGDEIALVLIGNPNYYTGQVHDMQAIAKAAHAHGCKVGFDCAHGAGNIPLDLHASNIDFAAWCTYKYMNSGPGSIAGCFIHERHLQDEDLPKLTGWWGHHLDSRFGMRDSFEPAEGAESWVVSNPPILSLAGVKGSLSLFDETGMDRLRTKSIALTSFAEYLVDALNSPRINIITPRVTAQRGAQLSLKVTDANTDLYDKLIQSGVIVDWREPNVIRVAPAPFYNTFEEVYKFSEILTELI